MARRSESLTPDRLCDAADAALQAAIEAADVNAGTCPNPADLVGGPKQPACLAGFSKIEINEATVFLVRLGYLQMTSDPTGAGADVS